MGRCRRRNTYKYENNPAAPGRDKTPYQFRRDMDESYIKLMAFLYVLGSYPQHL